MARNPYRSIEGHQLWSRAMSSPAPGMIDPMVGGPKVLPGEKVVTMGSCFAQHLARNMAGLGLDYYVAEPPPPGMSAEKARERNYGVFSARFGNLYTVRQAVQLYERAFGTFQPEDDVWDTTDGFVDAFRPQIEPVAFATAEEVRDAARHHLVAVRRMFEEADWLIFTLGLTEGWRSSIDGAVYPVAPGVAGGSFDPVRYEFVNFSAQAVQRDLNRFIELVRQTNPKCRFILTVSPVPLIATYEKRHVWTATTYSKAVLRVAADEVERVHDHVTYFPSYEVITSPAAAGRYYADDLREVTDLGVKHVMRIFRKHCVGVAGGTECATVERVPPVHPASAPAMVTAARSASPAPIAAGNDAAVICDEELIEKSVRELERLDALASTGSASAPDMDQAHDGSQLAASAQATPARPAEPAAAASQATKDFAAEFVLPRDQPAPASTPPKPSLIRRLFKRQ